MAVNPETVVFADDNPDDAMLFREAMAEVCPTCRVWCVSDGMSALDLLRNSPRRKGKPPADFVILDRDIMQVPDTEILATRVVSTWIGGKRVYEAK